MAHDYPPNDSIGTGQMLFSRRKKKEKGSREKELLTEEFSLTVLNDAGEEHQARLRSEIRNCPECAYQIVNPMTDRCPRCFTSVPPSEHTNCGECDYKGNCALAEVQQSRSSE